MDGQGAPLGPPRRARSQSRVAAGSADAWGAEEAAPSGYSHRGRSPGRVGSRLDGFGAAAYGALDGRGAAEESLYFDGRDAGVAPPHANGGSWRQDAPRGAPSRRGPPQHAGSARAAPGRAPSGYAPQQPGWPEDTGGLHLSVAGNGAGNGGWGDGGDSAYGRSPHAAPPPNAYRRGYGEHEPGSSEQWRAIEASLAAADSSKRAAADALARKAASASHAGALRRWASYAGRRSWYLVDSKIGTLKYQVLMLVGVAVVISVSGGKIVQLVRDMAVEEGLLDSYTTYSDGVWLAWSLIIDPGYGTWPDSVVGVRMRAVTVVIVIIGILYLSVIIALIVDAVQVKMEDLKKVCCGECCVPCACACADARCAFRACRL
jgi:hypothetical protein